MKVLEFLKEWRYKIVTPDFEKLHEVLLNNDLDFYKALDFKVEEWDKFGIDRNLVNYTLHFFANYQNIEFEESEKPDFNNDDFFRALQN